MRRSTSFLFSSWMLALVLTLTTVVGGVTASSKPAPGGAAAGAAAPVGSGTLCVVKFNDIDGDGKQGTNEPALNGWVFTVKDANGNTVGTIGTAPGLARCIDLPAGSYTVTETSQPGWTPTTAGGATQTVIVVAGQTTTVTFGNHQSENGQLCVQKFNDLDGSGKPDPGEPFLAGWVFTIRDANGNVIATVTTGQNGTACVNVPPGTYTVTETPQAGWTPTTPGGLIQTAVVVAGQTRNVTFGNHRTENGRLCVVKFNDLDGDGKHGSNEPALFGWVFTIRDASGTVVGTITTGDLVANCIDLPPGTYTVTETLQAGWTPTTPGGTSQTVTVTAGQTTTVTFGNRQSLEPGRICIVKFNDLNGNGRQDPGEPLLANWVFTVKDAAGNVVTTLVSGTDHNCFDVKSGTYTVTETLQAGWLPTTAGGVTQTVTVAAAQTINVIFGNRPFKPTPSTLVYECFELIQSRLDPRAVAQLVTQNFGHDTVNVRKSVRMCEPAVKMTTKPGTGSLAPQVFPNTELSLDLIDPNGGRHTVMFDGTMSQMRLRGTETIDTEMLQLGLRSTQPLQVQSPGGRHLDSFFDVFVELDPAVASPGKVDSFFDIFPEISLSGNSALGAREAAFQLMPGGALHFMGNQQGSYMLNPAAPIALLDASGNPSGWTIGGGILTPAPKPTPNQVMDRVLECFLLERGTDPNDPYTLRTKNFGLDTVMVHRATKMCEGAIKSRQTVIAAAVPKPAPIIWECFDIVSPKGIKAKTVYLTTRNFGLDQVTVLKPDSLCEEAMKIRLNAAGTAGQTIGQPTGRVLECFTIRAKTRNVPYFLRTRNFGLDTVRVGRGTLMCEPAVKQPLGKFVGN